MDLFGTILVEVLQVCYHCWYSVTLKDLNKHILSFNRSDSTL